MTPINALIKNSAHFALAFIALLATSAPVLAGFDFGAFDWFDSKDDNNRYTYPQNGTYSNGRGGDDRWRDYEMWEPNYWRYRIFDNDDDWSSPKSWNPMSSNRFSPNSPGGFPGRNSSNNTAYGRGSQSRNELGYRPRYDNNDDWFEDVPFFGNGDNDWFDDMPFIGGNDWFDDMPFFGNDHSYDNGYTDTRGRSNNDWKGSRQENWQNKSLNEGYYEPPQNRYAPNAGTNQYRNSPRRLQSQAPNSRYSTSTTYRNNRSPYSQPKISPRRQSSIPSPISSPAQSQQYNSRYAGGIGGYDDRYDDEYWRNYSKRYSKRTGERTNLQRPQPGVRGQRVPSPYTR